MSAIHFEADLDSKKLDDAIKQSNKNVKDWAKDVEKAGTQADQGLGKMTKSFKEAIKEQKQLIKDIESDVKKLQKAYDDATAGRQKGAAGRELNSAKKALSEEQARLNQLQQGQIAANKAEEGSISNLVGGLGKWVAGLVSVGAALKIAKSIIGSTESATRKFDEVIAGVTAGTQYFFKTIASGDWTNFFGNMDRAIRGAAEFVDTMEKLANKQNEQKIKSSEYDIKIAELRDSTYDKDESNNEARKKALEEIITLQRQKYTEEAKLAQDLYDANLKKAATDSGLSEKQIENFIKEYDSFEKLIEVGERYNQITKLTRKAGMNAGYVADLLKERNALGANATEAGKYVQQISKVTPEVRKQLADFATAANEAEAAYGQKNRRDKMQLAEVENKIKEAKESAAKEAKEAEKIENKIKVQEDLLAEAVIKGNKEEIKQIAEKIVLLKEELALRESNVNAALRSAMGNVIVPPSANITGLKAPTLLPGGIKAPNTLAKAPTFNEGDYIPGTTILSEAGKAKQKKADAEYDKDRLKNLNKELDLRSQIADAAANLVFKLGEVIGLGEQEQQQLGAILDSFAKLAAGDVAGAAITMITSLIELIPTHAKAFAAEIEHINQLIDEQNRLIEKSERKGGQAGARKGLISVSEEQKKATEDEIKRLEKQQKLLKLANPLWLNPIADLKYSSNKKKLAELKQQLIDIGYSIADAQQALDDFLMGGITENTIADAIAQAFQEGKTSIDDFGDYMNQVLIDAVMNIFKANILDSPLMQTYMSAAKEALSDNILTDVEKQRLSQLGKEFADTMKPTWEGLTSALNMGGDTAINNGLSMGIQRQITEETGSEISGIIRRIADDVRGNKDYNLLGINHLTAIESNTFQTVVQLQLAVIELKNIVSNTNQKSVAGF